MTTLTQQERYKFAQWLTQEANSIAGTARQMKELKVPEVVIEKFNTEAVACMIVAAKLQSLETVTL